jgi:hypothetical protein
VLLAEYDIVYVITKAVKRSAIANYLAFNVVEDYVLLDFDLLDKDVLSIEDDDELND